VRKLFDAVGLTVSRLIRIRYGNIVLPHGLKRGVWIDLADADVRAIRRLASGDGAPRDDRRGNERGPNTQRTATTARTTGPVGTTATTAIATQCSARSAPRRSADAGRRPEQEREYVSDFDADLPPDPLTIPNPLEQTFDKRFVQNPRHPAGGRGFSRGGGGFGAGGEWSGPVESATRARTEAARSVADGARLHRGRRFHRKNRGGGGGNRGGGRRWWIRGWVALAAEAGRAADGSSRRRRHRKGKCGARGTMKGFANRRDAGKKHGARTHPLDHQTRRCREERDRSDLCPFRGAGLRIVASKMAHLSRGEAEAFYAVHKGRPFFNDLVSFMVSGPVMIQVLEGEDAIAKNRQLMGATDPKKAEKGTIRADFADSIDANAVHGSDGAADGSRRVAFFFPAMNVYSR
jgi:nucleoside-diphosphate kinase